MNTFDERPIALVTGVGRRAGIGVAVAERLLRDGFDVGCARWTPYDERMDWGPDGSVEAHLKLVAADVGGRSLILECDLERTESIPELFDKVEDNLGVVSVLVMSHCESVDSTIISTTIESFDRHFSVNARATWLLIREYGLRYGAIFGAGRIIALTSDDTDGNLPYGASKGALDRITLAATREFDSRLGATANVVNPGPTDTGWMTESLKAQIVERTPLGRLGKPSDAANLVSFLCSKEGGWINGQLLTSDGGGGSN